MPRAAGASLPNRHRRSLPCGSGRLTRAPTSGSPPEQTARPKRGWEAGHPLKRVESGANCEDQRREDHSQEPLVSRDFAPLGRLDVTTENRGVPGSSPGLAIGERAGNWVLAPWTPGAGRPLKAPPSAFSGLFTGPPLARVPYRSLRPTRASRAAGGDRSRRADGAGAHSGRCGFVVVTSSWPTWAAT
jgi:hypothetical protein